MQSLVILAAIVPAALAQTFYGCYTEVPTRALTGSSLIDYDNMTITECATHCTGFDMWGLEYSGEWYDPPTLWNPHAKREDKKVDD
jgi:hypothetical protein